MAAIKGNIRKKKKKVFRQTRTHTNIAQQLCTDKQNNHKRKKRHKTGVET